MIPLNVVFYAFGPYESFERRGMIRAMARELAGRGKVVCVEPWVRGLGHSPIMRQIEPNLYVYQPHEPPHQSALGRLGAKRAHWQSVARRLRRALDDALGVEGNRTAWVYKPEQIRLVGLANETHLVYECCEEHGFDMQGRRVPSIWDMERKLLRAADLVFVTSEQLRPARASLNDSVSLLQGGVDFDQFHSPAGEVPARIAKLPRPRIGHIGGLTACLDLELLREVAARRPEWSFIQIGPAAPGVDACALRALPNCHFLDAVSQDELPGCMKGLDAGLMLYKRNRFTSAIDPLTLHQYLAAGVAVVTTGFASLGPAEQVVWTAQDAPEFIDSLEAALTRDGAERKLEGLALARSRDWSNGARLAIGALQSLREPSMMAA